MKYAVIVLALCAAGMFSFLRAPIAPHTPRSTALIQSMSTPVTHPTVTHVVDGDTIELSTGEIVRYIGVDTPETKHPTKPVQCFGKEASAYNSSLVLGKTVILTKDISETDRYGRLLRYVSTTDDGAPFNASSIFDDHQNRKSRKMRGRGGTGKQPPPYTCPHCREDVSSILDKGVHEKRFCKALKTCDPDSE